MENDINIDYADYQTILSHNGKVDGRVGSSKVDDFLITLDDDFKKSLQMAKGVLVEFEKNDEMPLIQISILMSDLHTLLDENTDVIFGVTINNTIENEDIQFKIIASGIDLPLMN